MCTFSTSFISNENQVCHGDSQIRQGLHCVCSATIAYSVMYYLTHNEVPTYIGAYAFILAYLLFLMERKHFMIHDPIHVATVQRRPAHS